MLGVIVVSHSHNIAKGVVSLISEVAKDVPITYAGGLEDNQIGTSFDAILAAVESNPADELLAFFDLGSARMNLDLVSDFTDKTIRVYQVPIVEGSYTASALLQAGAPLGAIEEQLQQLVIQK